MPQNSMTQTAHQPTDPNSIFTEELHPMLIGDWETRVRDGVHTLAFSNPERQVLARLTVREVVSSRPNLLPDGLSGQIQLNPVLSPEFEHLLSYALLEQVSALGLSSVEVPLSLRPLESALHHGLVNMELTAVTPRGLRYGTHAPGYPDPTALLRVTSDRARPQLRGVFDAMSRELRPEDGSGESDWMYGAEFHMDKEQLRGLAAEITSGLGMCSDHDTDRVRAALMQAMHFGKVASGAFDYLELSGSGAASAQVFEVQHSPVLPGAPATFESRSQDPVRQGWRQLEAQKVFTRFAASGGAPALTLRRAAQLTSALRVRGDASRSAHDFIEGLAQKVGRTSLD